MLLKNETGTKLSNVYNGPYKVIQEQTPNVTILKDDKLETVHKNRTKPFRS